MKEETKKEEKKPNSIADRIKNLTSQQQKKEEKEQPKAEIHETPPPRKVRKKKEISSGHSSVWLPKDVHRKAKLLALWMEAEGIPRPGSIGELLAEAFDTLIDIKYPKAKKYVEMK